MERKQEPTTSLSPADLQQVIDNLLAARQRSLVSRQLDDILSSIEHVTSRFLDPTSEERQEAEARLPAETGLSPAMIRHTLPLIFRQYYGRLLEEFLDDEFGSASRLDRFAARLSRNYKVYGLPLVMQILAGNIPGAGLDGIIFSLLVKSATLVKASSSAPCLPTLFARALAQGDPALSDCLAVVLWPGGHTALEDVAFSRADLVIASGSDASLAAIRPRVQGRFIGYGHKVSFSAIGRKALTDAQRLARLAAYDIALFDQQGCLSPQLIYVEEGGAATAKEFARLLAQSLEQWQQDLPRGQIPPEASLAIRRARDEAEWQALAGKDLMLYTSANGTEWTVIYDADPTFTPSPLYRTIRVKPLTTLTQLVPLLAPWQAHLEAVGAAVESDGRPGAEEILGSLGVSRICPIGTMQTPPLSWRQGGRPRIADLVRWVGIE